MVYLHILGSGQTTAETANSRGHLFEQLISALCEQLKMTILRMDKSENGKEIDLEGKTVVGNLGFFAECKAHERPLNSTDVQKFGFKFTTKLQREGDTRGLLFTLSPLNSSAQEVWDKDLEALYQDKVTCFLHDTIVGHLLDHYGLDSPDVIRHKAAETYGRSCGDTQLLCVEGNSRMPSLYWAQLLMSSDGTEPNLVAFYSERGAFVQEKAAVQRLLKLKPDLATTKLTCLNLQEQPPQLAQLDDVSPARTVVRVRMGSDWFDYRFPAAPQFFVGREQQRSEFIRLVRAIRKGETSTRGVLLSGKSGIGKSSLALMARHELREEQVILLPIDSRLCDDVSFLFDSVNELLLELRQLPDLREPLRNVRVRGLDSLIETLTAVHDAISGLGYLAILFFDQFERVFEHPIVTRAIRTLLFEVTERQLSLLFGFAWKSDLWSLAEGFPHSERDDIAQESYPVRQLGQFGQEETSQILRQLDLKWGSKLSILIHSQLAAFSRGLPWLLKKVCSHILDQKERGVTENELVETNLKLQDLFESDLSGLDDEERSLLRSIAPMLPATLRRLSEYFEISNIDEALHRFIDRRILVKITEDIGGSYANVKYDAYSDIFREFLITGTVPIEDAYYFYMYPKGVLKFFEKIRERGSLSIDQEIEETGKQVASIYNLSRDLRFLGLVNVRNRVFTLADEVSDLAEDELLAVIQGRLKRNRVVSLALSELNDSGALSIREIAQLLREVFPSVRAKETTWNYYARVTAMWLHSGRLAFYDRRDRCLHRVDDEAVFEYVVDRGNLSLAGIRFPVCFRNAVIECLDAVGEIKGGIATIPELIAALDKSYQSVEKALSDNVKLGFVSHSDSPGSYCVTRLGHQFLTNHYEAKRELFGHQCYKMPVFKKFVSEVDAAAEDGVSAMKAAGRLVNEMGLELADATVDKLGSMLANWAEYGNLIVRSGRLCFMKGKGYVPEQMPMF